MAEGLMVGGIVVMSVAVAVGIAFAVALKIQWSRLKAKYDIEYGALPRKTGTTGKAGATG